MKILFKRGFSLLFFTLVLFTRCRCPKDRVTSTRLKPKKQGGMSVGGGKNNQKVDPVTESTVDNNKHDVDKPNHDSKDIPIHQEVKKKLKEQYEQKKQEVNQKQPHKEQELTYGEKKDPWKQVYDKVKEKYMQKYKKDKQQHQKAQAKFEKELIKAKSKLTLSTKNYADLNSKLESLNTAQKDKLGTLKEELEKLTEDYNNKLQKLEKKKEDIVKLDQNLEQDLDSFKQKLEELKKDEGFKCSSLDLI